MMMGITGSRSGTHSWRGSTMMTLCGREWLNNSHIHAVQQLIPDLQHIRGLQNPIFGHHFALMFMWRWCRFFILGEITGLQRAPSGLHPPQQCGCMTVWTQLYHLIQRSRLRYSPFTILAILHSPEEEIKLEYANVQGNTCVVILVRQ